MACAEKTLDYCSCLANYTYVSNGTTYHSDGGCIQDDPDIPPWCIVYEKSCSQPPPKKPDGQFWDICRGAPCTHPPCQAGPMEPPWCASVASKQIAAQPAMDICRHYPGLVQPPGSVIGAACCKPGACQRNRGVCVGAAPGHQHDPLSCILCVLRIHTLEHSRLHHHQASAQELP